MMGKSSVLVWELLLFVGGDSASLSLHLQTEVVIRLSRVNSTIFLEHRVIFSLPLIPWWSYGVLWEHYCSQDSCSLAFPSHMVCIAWLPSKIKHCYAAPSIRKAGHSPVWVALEVISLSDNFCSHHLSVLLWELRKIKVQARRLIRAWNNHVQQFQPGSGLEPKDIRLCGQTAKPFSTN